MGGGAHISYHWEPIVVEFLGFVGVHSALTKVRGNRAGAPDFDEGARR